MSTAKWSSLSYAVLLVVGLLTLGIAIVVGLLRTQSLLHSQSAVGVVTRVLFGGSHVEIEFHVPGEGLVKYAQGGLVFGLSPGQEVVVLYNPSDPRGSACVDKFGALWASTILLGVIAAAMILPACQGLFQFTSRSD